MFFFFNENKYPQRANDLEKFIGDCLYSSFEKKGKNYFDFVSTNKKVGNRVVNYYVEGIPFEMEIFQPLKYRTFGIEVKLNKILDSQLNHNDRSIPNLIFISLSEPQEHIKRNGYDIFGMPFIRKLTDRFQYEALANNIYGLLEKKKGPLSLEPSLSDSQIRDKSDKNRNEFREYLTHADNTHVSLILGNGVSIDYGASSWDSLVDGIADYLHPYYSDDVEQLVKYLGENKMATAEVASQTINSTKYMDVLYSKIYGKYEDSMIKRSTLLSAVADIVCSHWQIEVATYNYDIFLEMVLQSKYGVQTISPYNGRCKQAAPGKRTVFHLHGLLDYTPRNLHHFGKGILLTQSDYYRTYGGASSWCVKKQKAMLKNNAVLFVGSSMTDIFQMSLVKEYGSGNVFALLADKELTNDNKSLVFKYYARMGVKVILSTSFKELPFDLTDLFK